MLSPARALASSLTLVVFAACSNTVDDAPDPSAHSVQDASIADPRASDATIRDTGVTPDAASPPADSSAADASSPVEASTSCTPTPNGPLSVTGDVVTDPRTCLSWMRLTQEGVTMNPSIAPSAIQYCDDLVLGNYDDWRVPNIDELASILTHCGTYLGNTPSGPWDDVFTVTGDGYWTTNSPSSGHICAIGSNNGGGYYKYGTDGPQRVRCVRGAGVVPHVKDCNSATGCKDW